MAELSQQRFELEKRFMAQFWDFRKRTGTPEQADEYWKYVVNEIDRIVKQDFSYDRYVKALFLCMLDDLEFRSGGEKFADEGKYNLVLMNRFRRGRNLPDLVVKKDG